MRNPITSLQTGPLTFEVFGQETVIDKVSDIPHLLAATSDEKNVHDRHKSESDRSHFIHVTADQATSQTERINAFRETNLPTELASVIALATKQMVRVIFPQPATSYYNHVYPDVKLGDLTAQGQKIFAKMFLTPLYTLRMYRLVHQNPLQYQPEICGIWKTATEAGVWSLETKYRGTSCTLVIGDKEKFASDLVHEFTERWPFMPIEFHVTTHESAMEWHKGLRDQKA